MLPAFLSWFLSFCRPFFALFRCPHMHLYRVPCTVYRVFVLDFHILGDISPEVPRRRVNTRRATRTGLRGRGGEKAKDGLLLSIDRELSRVQRPLLSFKVSRVSRDSMPHTGRNRPGRGVVTCRPESFERRTSSACPNIASWRSMWRKPSMGEVPPEPSSERFTKESHEAANPQDRKLKTIKW